MKMNPGEILTSLADNICEKVLGCLGRQSVISIFLGGSIPEGRIAFFEKDGFIEVYSDLDIYVIVEPGTDAGDARKLARSALRGLQLEGAGFKVFPHPDVGVFTEQDLVSQPARPGTVGIKAHHQVLFGDKEVLKKTAVFKPSAIEKEEALYLLENRLLEEAEMEEALETDGSEGLWRYAFYLSLKSCLDVAAAFLIFRGRYLPGLGERMRTFSQLASSRETGPRMPDAAVDLVEYGYACMRNLQEALAGGIGGLLAVRPMVQRLVLSAWRGMAGCILGGGENSSWKSLILSRCNKGAVLQNLREALVFGRRVGVKRTRMLTMGLTKIWISPKEAIRLSGLCEILAKHAEIEGTSVEPPRILIRSLDSLTRALGFEGGTVFQRTRKLFRELS